MAVPKFYEFFGSFLRALSDGNVHKSKDVQKAIAVDMNPESRRYGGAVAESETGYVC